MATRSPLARLYNDRSPLESHHASKGFELLEACGVLAGLPAAKLPTFRALFLVSVLSTDSAALPAPAGGGGVVGRGMSRRC